MTPALTIALAIVTPFVGGALIVATGRHPNLREGITLVTASILFVLVVSLVPAVMRGTHPALLVTTMIPGLGIHFVVEPLGMLFAVVASFLWIVTSLYSIGYMRGHDETNQTRFYFYFAVAIGATMGVAFAGNMLTLFAFYELLTLSTFPLVAHHGTEEAKRAGRLYLGLLLGTSIIFQLFAIVWTWTAAGTLDFTTGGILKGKVSETAAGILLALYVFGIGKAAVMPFHRWLPAAMVAPTPVSALLHAVAVVKAGVFTVVKVVVYIFGTGYLHDVGQSQWLQYVAAATILLASLVAMTKDNLKARLAYSTVSQLSYVVLGAMLANSMGIIGGSMQIAMHAFAKITLFFCAGAIMVAHHKTEISEMRGIGRAMPITMAAFLVASLSIIGLPPLGGMWSKWYLALGAMDAGNLFLVGVLMLSSLLNIAYLLPIPIRGFFGDPSDNPMPTKGHEHDPEHDHSHDRDPISGIREAPLPCLIAIVVTSLGCLMLFLFPGTIFALLKPLSGP